jgi:hypothetical protein
VTEQSSGRKKLSADVKRKGVIIKKSFFCFMSAMIIGTTIFAQQPVVAKAPPMALLNPLTPDEAISIMVTAVLLNIQTQEITFTHIRSFG